jgi:predicted dehydrogenase
MSAPLKFAIVGCGNISRKHADILAWHLPGAALVAVCDVSKERVEIYAEKYGVAAFTDIHTMMREMEGKIDVVNILTPTGYHLSNVRDLTPYRCHIVLEKPLAVTLADAEEIIELCDQVGVRLFVVKQNRFNTPVQNLYRALQAKRFGKLVAGAVRVRWCRQQAYYDSATWRGTPALDGGVFTNQASHHVDLLTWLMGDVESVFAYTTRRLLSIATEDTGVAVLRFRNGAVGSIEATVATRPKDLEASVSVLGEHGSVEIGGFAVDEMKLWAFDHYLPEDDAVLEQDRRNPMVCYAYAHREFLGHVVHAIRTGEPALVDGYEAIKSLRVIEAIYRSAATRKEVCLPFPQAA